VFKLVVDVPDFGMLDVAATMCNHLYPVKLLARVEIIVLRILYYDLFAVQRKYCMLLGGEPIVGCKKGWLSVRGRVNCQSL
jgi:hypothetical protein